VVVVMMMVVGLSLRPRLDPRVWVLPLELYRYGRRLSNGHID
jgi:hypothetical protein